MTIEPKFAIGQTVYFVHNNGLIRKGIIYAVKAAILDDYTEEYNPSYFIYEIMQGTYPCIEEGSSSVWETSTGSEKLMSSIKIDLMETLQKEIMVNAIKKIKQCETDLEKAKQIEKEIRESRLSENQGENLCYMNNVTKTLKEKLEEKDSI